MLGLLADQIINTDACQAETLERHAMALECFRGYRTQIPGAGFEAMVPAAGETT